MFITKQDNIQRKSAHIDTGGVPILHFSPPVDPPVREARSLTMTGKSSSQNSTNSNNSSEVVTGRSSKKNLEPQSQSSQSFITGETLKIKLIGGGQNKNSNNNNAAAADFNNLAVMDCNLAVLEQFDNCVECVEGVGLQQDFEERLDSFLNDRTVLSPEEAAWIRLQSIERDLSKNMANISVSDLVDINLCGEDSGTVFEAQGGKQANGGAPPTTLNTDIVPKSLERFTAQSCLFIPHCGYDDLLGDSNVYCAVCFDPLSASNGARAKLPCCDMKFAKQHDASTTDKFNICTSCILILTPPTWDSISRVSRCLHCRTWITIDISTIGKGESLKISTVSTIGTCRICSQMNRPLVEKNSICDACFVGRRFPLLYECQKCHGTQQIPHPVYRHQASPHQFSTVTWACQGCQKFTHWRIRSDQIGLIPLGDAPLEWNGMVNALALARARVKLARNDVPNGPALMDDLCVIL